MNKVLGVILIVMLMVSNVSYAWPDFVEHRDFAEHRDFDHREHGRYEYRNGGWWLGGALVGALAVGVIIASLPPRREIVYIGGVQYWYDGRYYYQQTPDGYMVVQPVQPEIVVVQQPQYARIQYQGTEYLVSNGRWFVQGVSGLIEVRDPTR